KNSLSANRKSSRPSTSPRTKLRTNSKSRRTKPTSKRKRKHNPWTPRLRHPFVAAATESEYEKAKETIIKIATARCLASVDSREFAQKPSPGPRSHQL